MQEEPIGKVIGFECGHFWILKSDKPIESETYLAWLLIVNQEHSQIHHEKGNKK